MQSCYNCYFIRAHKGWQRLLSACVSMWTESYRICKVWARINKTVPRCFPSYGLWLTSQIIKSVNISKSIYINQSISINQFYSIKASNFILEFFLFFAIVHHNSVILIHVERVCHSNISEKPDICTVASWSC